MVFIIILLTIGGVILMHVLDTNPIKMFFGFFLDHFGCMNYWAIVVSIGISVFILYRYEEWRPLTGQRIRNCRRFSGKVRYICLLCCGLCAVGGALWGKRLRQSGGIIMSYEQAFMLFNTGSYFDLNKNANIIQALCNTYNEYLLVGGILLAVYAQIKRTLGRLRAKAADDVVEKNTAIKAMLCGCKLCISLLPTCVLIWGYDYIAGYLTQTPNASEYVVSKFLLSDVTSTDVQYYKLLSLYICLHVSLSFNLMAWMRFSCTAKSISGRIILTIVSLPVFCLLSMIPVWCLYKPFSFILVPLVFLGVLSVIIGIFGQEGELSEEDKTYYAICRAQFCGTTLGMDSKDIERIRNAAIHHGMSDYDRIYLRKQLSQNGRTAADDDINRWLKD